jgi:hypothetical protein
MLLARTYYAGKHSYNSRPRHALKTKPASAEVDYDAGQQPIDSLRCLGLPTSTLDFDT